MALKVPVPSKAEFEVPLFRPDLVDLWEVCVPGVDINKRAHEFDASAQVESAVRQGLMAGSVLAGNTAHRFVAGLPPIGTKRLAEILIEVQAIQDSIRNGA